MFSLAKKKEQKDVMKMETKLGTWLIACRKCSGPGNEASFLSVEVLVRVGESLGMGLQPARLLYTHSRIYMKHGAGNKEDPVYSTWIILLQKFCSNVSPRSILLQWKQCSMKCDLEDHCLLLGAFFPTYSQRSFLMT